LSVEVPCPPDVRVTDVLPSDTLGPDVGETTVERLMVPANPFILVRVTSPVPDVPRGRLREDGLTEREKSDTITRMEVECATDPLAPVTLTV
jgi:hypothetical protein